MLNLIGCCSIIIIMSHFPVHIASLSVNYAVAEDLILMCLEGFGLEGICFRCGVWSLQYFKEEHTLYYIFTLVTKGTFSDKFTNTEQCEIKRAR